MSLIDQLKEEDNKKNKLFHQIIMAAATAKHNIERSKTAENEADKEKFLAFVSIDLEFIERMALLANSGTYEEEK